MALTGKKLLVGVAAAVTLSLSGGAAVSATNGNGHGNGNGNGNNGNSQVSGVTLGVQQKTNVGTNHDMSAKTGNGNNNGGNGYGGTNVDVDQNVFVQIGNVIGGAVNITINFVNNIFS